MLLRPRLAEQFTRQLFQRRLGLGQRFAQLVFRACSASKLERLSADSKQVQFQDSVV